MGKLLRINFNHHLVFALLLLAAVALICSNSLNLEVAVQAGPYGSECPASVASNLCIGSDIGGQVSPAPGAGYIGGTKGIIAVYGFAL